MPDNGSAVDAYPLAWPAGWPRTPADERTYSRFSTMMSGQYGPQKRDLSVHDATLRVLAELDRLGADANEIVISTNMELRRDGLPRSDRGAPSDPGVAVYWTVPAGDGPQCMAIDLYDSVAGNLGAVAATVSAMRAIERHGGAQILKRAFQGFKALPSATSATLSTAAAADILSVHIAGVVGGPSAAARRILEDHGYAQASVRAAAARTHPDRGGAHGDFQRVQDAKRVLEAHHGRAL